MESHPTILSNLKTKSKENSGKIIIFLIRSPIAAENPLTKRHRHNTLLQA
jgi:hypothetical protein